MAYEPLARYERILDEHQWMDESMNWLVVQTLGPAPGSVDSIGARLSKLGVCDVDMEMDPREGWAEYDGRLAVSVDLQQKGYFLFSDTDLYDESPIRELSLDGCRVWALRAVLEQHEMIYAFDGEILMTWNTFRITDRPLAHDPIDEDIQFLQEVCAEEGKRFDIAAMMAVFELGSGVAMDVNWASAPRPAVIISDPIW
ncbi:hypothetical protein ACIBO2_02345 [Nonomuraea sp. NPDC050022]|uniref:hypothetical protein n=1 Tax=Nonomuraea sp. NPDC050022 TaxID=3364358 RepID=UPI00378C3D93